MIKVVNHPEPNSTSCNPWFVVCVCGKSVICRHVDFVSSGQGSPHVLPVLLNWKFLVELGYYQHITLDGILINTVSHLSGGFGNAF